MLAFHSSDVRAYAEHLCLQGGVSGGTPRPLLLPRAQGSSEAGAAKAEGTKVEQAQAYCAIDKAFEKIMYLRSKDMEEDTREEAL